MCLVIWLIGISGNWCVYVIVLVVLILINSVFIRLGLYVMVIVLRLVYVMCVF